MPRVTRVKIKMRKAEYTDALFDALAEALTEYFERIYPLIIAYAPRESTNDPRKTPGLVANKIQLMDHEIKGRRYRTIGIPGCSIPESDEYRAMVATQALHYGWAGPRIIKGNPVLTFRTGRFQKGGKVRKGPPGKEYGKWVVTQFVRQTGKYRKYPWIWKIIENTIPLWEEIINRKLEEKFRKIPSRRIV